MDHEPLWARHHVVREGLEVEVFTQPAVNLALVHNRVPLVSSVTVRNIGDQPQVDITVTVSLHGQGHDLSEPWTRTNDGELAAGDEFSWSDFGTVHPSHEHLDGLNESHPATLRVVASRTWGDDAELAIPLDVLAHNEWFNSPIFFSSLAAFVQPNTHAVTVVLDAAADILRTTTGDASLSGYQEGPERAAQIAAAIYAALHARGVRYINPPAHFEESGQKVRTTAQVLDERFGTCIDLSVTYAACLEQAGLRPVLWLIDRHAFAGFVREDEGLSEAVITEPHQLVNLVESGRVVPVEAAYYGDAPAQRFAGAISTAKAHFSDPDVLQGLVVVSAARRDGIRPLPSKDEVVEVVAPKDDPTPAASGDALDLPPELRATHAGDNVLLDVSDDAPPRVTKWKRSLLDLSTRNRLLNLRPSAQVLDLHVPAGALPLFDDLVHGGRAIRLRPQDALSDVHLLQGARRAQDVDAEVLTRMLREDHTVHAAITQAKYQAGLRGLHRTARTMYEETGNSNLYLTFGALVHRTPSGKEARAPLFLIPARIEGGSGRSQFRVAVDPANVATPNHCLVEWLRIKHGVRIEALERPRLDDSGIDVAYALPAIRAALLEHALEFRIDEVASLAICQFSTFGMWQDLERSWDVLQRSPIVQHLALHAGDSFQDPAGDGADIALQEVDEADIAVPIPADGSQLRAVALAASGRTFVLEGPPGTGKSQTITNLIAHALDCGKSVLFVAEKQAALDVVKRRLRAVGLEDFTLDLHGKDQQPALIRQQLKRAIDNEASYERRGWDAKLATFRGRHAPLAEYPAKVHSKNGLGYSLWSAAEGLRQFDDGPSAPVPASFVLDPPVGDEDIRGALQNFARASRASRLAPGHPWALVGRVTSEELNAPTVRAAVEDLRSALQSLGADADAQRLAGLVVSPRDLATVLPQVRERLDHAAFGTAELKRVRAASWRAARAGLIEELDRFGEQHQTVLGTFTPTFLEDGDVAGLSALAEDARKGLFGKKKRAERFEQAVGSLVLPGTELAVEQVDGLVLAVSAARDHAARLATDARDLLGDATPTHWTPLRADASARLDSAWKAIDRAVAFADAHPDLWNRLEEHGAASEAAVRTLEAVSAAAERWLTLLGTDDGDLARWTAGRPWSTAWQADLDRWAADVADGGDVPIRRWSQMVAFLDPLHEAGLDEFREALLTASLPAEEAEVAFLRGSAAASVRERRAVGGLDVFDAALRGGEIEDFATAASALREEQIVALPAALIERRSYQVGRLTGPVGELRRKLDAKRKGATFRQLIEQYGEEILEATPCFFVSPTSLAQFVPPGSVTFDLVVFDEASQVTVPQAIGALGRGRSAVIVGDSQQMPPTSVGKVSMTGTGEEDEEDAPPEDLESILTECVESGLPRLWLSWHYRSQDESLIAFSNQLYYEGNLASLPSPGGDSTAGVELRRVDGQFVRAGMDGELRTNRVEAEAIVAEVRHRVADPALAGQSMGVVTFNAQQQTLVQNLLDDCDDPLVAAQLRPDATEGIFVKNLENVQGDERDVILFSTAFSKRPEGGPLPMNFGPITAQGGEKRLNVAVTRARRKVVLFTSFDPADIDLARTSSRGMAHLRAYLEMAANGAAAMGSGHRALVGRDEIGESIAEALRGRGYEVEANYGLSEFSLDLVVREAGAERWQAAIVLDGPGWARRPTVADRDLTPGLLELLMGWGASLRVWLPEWLDDQEGVLDRVVAAIAAAKVRAEEERVRLAGAAAEQERLMEEARRRAEEEAAAGDKDEELDDEDPVEVETYVPANDHADLADLEVVMAEAFRAAEEREVARKQEDAAYASGLTASRTDVPDFEAPGWGDAGATASETADPEPAVPEVMAPLETGPVDRDWNARGEEYVEERSTSLGERADLDRTNSRTVRATITAAARRTVEQEGPIATERLARGLARRFGFKSVPGARQRFILDLVPPDLIHRSDLGDFVWPTQLDPTAWRGYRTTPIDLTRPLSDIAPEEIVNAMAAVCGQSPVRDDEQLFRETLAVFGLKRLTGQSQARLERCRDLGLARSRLTNDGDRYRAGA